MLDYCIDRPAMQPIRIITESIKVAKWLALYYGRYFKPNNAIPKMTIEISEINNDKYEITYNNETIITNSFIKDFSDLLREITVCDSNAFVLHGASIEYHNEAYVFLAPSTGGKTTLTSYLCERKFGYITDDFTIIDKESLSIIPINKPIHLRLKSLFLLNNTYNFKIKTYNLDDGFTKRFIYQPNNICVESIPIRSIYFLKRNNEINKISKVPNVEKSIYLLKSLMFSKNVTSDILSINKLSKYPCYILEYSDLGFVEKLILEEGDRT
ncbi:MAG: hypothetical protein J6B22_02270 [Clostridia bacterium]|nr:hypothetical protein [Clostridia bacterium]